MRYTRVVVKLTHGDDVEISYVKECIPSDGTWKFEGISSNIKYEFVRRNVTAVIRYP